MEVFWLVLSGLCLVEFHLKSKGRISFPEMCRMIIGLFMQWILYLYSLYAYYPTLCVQAVKLHKSYQW